MEKTLFDIQKSIDKLLLKHPELSTYTIKNASQFPEYNHIHDYHWIAEFIERAWAHSYQRRDSTKISRFVYSAGYLEWLLGPPWADRELRDFVIDKSGKVAGISFGINKNIAIGASKFKIAMCFCKSVDPDHTGKGIAQLIHLNKQKKILEREEPYDAAAYWYDDLGRKKGGSMHTDTKIDPSLIFFEYPMLIRIFDYNRAVANSHLPPVQKIIARITGGIPEKPHLPRYLSVRRFEKNDLEQITSLLSLDQVPTTDSVGRYFYTEEEILRMLDFRPRYQDPFTTITTVMVEKGQVVGLLYGFRIPIQEKRQDNIFLIDGIWMNSRISIDKRHAFIVESLDIAWKEYNIYAAITVKGTFPEDNLGKRIFLPVMDPYLRVRRKKLYMAMAAFNEPVERRLKNTEKIHIDHK